MNNAAIKAVAVFLLSSAILLIGCSNSSPEQSKEKPLAKVGNSFIYPSELDYQFEKLIGARASLVDQVKVRERIRDSLVLSKQMAQKALSSMSEQDKKQLELQVSHYRDEILAKHYINEYVSVEVPTPKAINEYYNGHLHKFGGGTYISLIEFVFEESCPMDVKGDSLYKDERSLLTMLDKAKCKYSATRLEKSLEALSKPVQVQLLKKGVFKLQPSGTQIKAFYVKAISKRSAKPLSEVAASIRKMLAPIYMKKALKKERLALSQELDVEILE